MKAHDLLSSDPEILSGAVVFRGTRVPVEALFENLAGGVSIREFLADFPTVESKQVEAVLRLASERAERLFGIIACDHARLILYAIKLSKMKILVRSDRLSNSKPTDYSGWWADQNHLGIECFWWRNRNIQSDDVIWELVRSDSKVETWGVWQIITNISDPVDGNGIWRRTCVRMPFEEQVFGSGLRLERATEFAGRIVDAIAAISDSDELDDGVLVEGDQLTGAVGEITAGT